MGQEDPRRGHSWTGGSASIQENVPQQYPGTQADWYTALIVHSTFNRDGTFTLTVYAICGNAS